MSDLNVALQAVPERNNKDAKKVKKALSSTYFVPMTIMQQGVLDLRFNWLSMSSNEDLSVKEKT